MNTSESFRDLVTKESPKEILDPRAYCSSIACMTGPQYQRHNKIGVLKKVSKQTVFCKDCGHALFWVKGKHNGAVH